MAKELKTLLDIHTSVFEKTQLNQNATEASNMVLRLINENYVDISQLHRWRWLQSSSSTVAPKIYKTGSVTIANAAATVVGSASVSFTASMVGRKLRLDEGNETYTIASRVSATRITLTASYRGAAVSSGAFRIYQDQYNMASDCEEVMDIYHYDPLLRRARIMEPMDNRMMINYQLGSNLIELKGHHWTHGNPTSSGTRTVIVWPPGDADNDFRLRVEYIKRVTSLSASTDQPLMPITYRSAIMWGAVADLFMREGMEERMKWAEQKKNAKIFEMKQDGEITDRRPRLMFAHNHRRTRLISPGTYDLGKAWETDSWKREE